MAKSPLTVDEVLTLLEAAPQRVAAATAGVAPARLRRAPARDAWSANDVLAHLRSCSDVWGGCIVTMLAEDRPTIRAVNPRSWMDRTSYPELDFHRSLRAYAKQRGALLRVLEALPRTSWSRGARVTGAGAVLERTVLFYAQWLARHERAHVKQIERLVTASRSSPRAPVRAGRAS
jgi:hypothetical protein